MGAAVVVGIGERAGAPETGCGVVAIGRTGIPPEVVAGTGIEFAAGAGAGVLPGAVATGAGEGDGVGASP